MNTLDRETEIEVQCNAVRLILRAANFTESTLTEGDVKSAGHWPYGFMLDTDPADGEDPRSVRIVLWDQLWDRDRTGRQAMQSLAQLDAYAVTLRAAGYTVEYVSQRQGLPWLIATPAD
jgi:hypothetical protein